MRKEKRLKAKIVSAVLVLTVAFTQDVITTIVARSLKKRNRKLNPLR